MKSVQGASPFQDKPWGNRYRRVCRVFGMVGLVVAAGDFFALTTLPRVDMGGAIAGMMCTAIFALQIIPIAGWGVAALYEPAGARTSGREAVFWLWALVATGAVAIGGLAAFG